jgi:hypothetical protein
MLYVKNLRTWESVARILIGGALVTFGLLAIKSLVLGRVMVVVGSVGLVTGLFGFCPMCAMIGRKL